MPRTGERGGPQTRARISDIATRMFIEQGFDAVTVAQIAIAWVAAQGDDIVPLIGARQRTRLDEALGASSVRLTADDLAAIERAVPKGAAAGDRYAAAQMATLDSEPRRG